MGPLGVLKSLFPMGVLSGYFRGSGCLLFRSDKGPLVSLGFLLLSLRSFKSGTPPVHPVTFLQHPVMELSSRRRGETSIGYPLEPCPLSSKKSTPEAL